jgi:integrase
MAKQLTAAAVAKLRPKKGERREIPDAGCSGLYLIVQASGHKSWAFRFRSPSGRSVKLTLGAVDFSGVEGKGTPTLGAPLTLVGARALVSDLQRQRAQGRDVAVIKHREHLERLERGKKTFGSAVLDFIEDAQENRSWRDQARYLGLYSDFTTIPRGLADRWRDKPISEITDDDIYAIVDEARAKGVPGLERRAKGPTKGQARAMYANLSTLFAWLVEHRRLRASPVASVARPAPSLSRDRVLDKSEIVKFWRAAEGEQFGPLLKLLLLTGCRLNEAALLRRSELSNNLATWSLPATRTKNKRSHIVPLPPAARALIASVPGSGDLVFSVNGRTPSGWSRIKRRLDDVMKIPPWVIHDLRRTCATGMAELGIPPHIVEACLNHVSGARAGVAGTYNRAAYSDEKKLALERWADHVEGLVTSRTSNVVPMKRGAK